jgi:lysozyme family protein
MPNVNFTMKIQEEYQRLFDTVEPSADWLSHDMLSHSVAGMGVDEGEYRVAVDGVGVPWQFAAILHRLESSGDFRTHLHNGDPLSSKTTHVPKGRPKEGAGPFTWAVSARDAILFKRLDKVAFWNAPRALYEFEKWNGFGYRLYHPETLSPYLWGGSNHYKGGKYASDGRYLSSTMSRQIGAALYLRRFMEKDGTFLRPIMERVPPMFPPWAWDPHTFVPAVQRLQRVLNQEIGIYLAVDGYGGSATSEAFHAMSGNYLKGDPRGWLGQDVTPDP